MIARVVSVPAGPRDLAYGTHVGLVRRGVAGGASEQIGRRVAAGLGGAPAGRAVVPGVDLGGVGAGVAARQSARRRADRLAGDAAETDPVCSLSPQRDLVDAAIREAGRQDEIPAQWIYRIDPVRVEA